MPLRLFGRSRVRLPDLVTVLVAHQPDGTLAAEFIGEGSLPPDSHGYADMGTLVSAVERAGLGTLREGQKISYEIVADRRSGKSSADNLRAAG